MTPVATTLPPPLSDAPSVETLERLLVGLQQPMRRGVPTPPVTPGPVAVAAAPPRAAAAPVVAQAPPQPLSWSAGRRHHGPGARAATALGVASVVAIGVLAGLAAAGEVPLP